MAAVCDNKGVTLQIRVQSCLAAGHCSEGVRPAYLVPVSGETVWLCTLGPTG